MRPDGGEVPVEEAEPIALQPDVVRAGVDVHEHERRSHLEQQRGLRAEDRQRDVEPLLRLRRTPTGERRGAAKVTRRERVPESGELVVFGAREPPRQHLPIGGAMEFGVRTGARRGLRDRPGRHRVRPDVLENDDVPTLSPNAPEVLRCPRPDERFALAIDPLLRLKRPVDLAARRKRVRPFEEYAPAIAQRHAIGRGRCIPAIGALGSRDR